MMDMSVTTLLDQLSSYQAQELAIAGKAIL
jgi:hypothetical protein